jgi:hypothetical protein
MVVIVGGAALMQDCCRPANKHGVGNKLLKARCRPQHITEVGHHSPPSLSDMIMVPSRLVGPTNPRRRYCGVFTQLPSVADDADRHWPGQADVLHARPPRAAMV